MKLLLLKEMKRKGPKEFTLDQTTLMNCFNKGPDIGKSMEAFLATGNIMSNSGLGLMQVHNQIFTMEFLSYQIKVHFTVQIRHCPYSAI